MVVMHLTTVKEYIIQEIFCINLKWYRFDRGYSQEKLAELCNLTPKYISDLERGKFCPSFNKLQDIAKALNIEPFELLKPEHMEEVSRAITRNSIKALINDGFIKAKPVNGISSYRAKHNAEQKKKDGLAEVNSVYKES